MPTARGGTKCNMGYGEHHLDHGPRSENPYFGGAGVSPISSEQQWGIITPEQLQQLKGQDMTKDNEQEAWKELARAFDAYLETNPEAKEAVGNLKGYKLEDGEVKETHFIEGLFAIRDNQIENTVIEDVRISTVFLPHLALSGDRPCRFFETMVFGGEFDGKRLTYETLEKARAGHHHVVQCVQKQKWSYLETE